MTGTLECSVGEKVQFLDAYGKNPVNATILKFYERNAVLVEDDRGIRHYGGLWRLQKRERDKDEPETTDAVVGLYEAAFGINPGDKQ